AAAAPGSPPEPLAPAGPLADARLYIDPDSNARRQADAWRATRPADAAAMDKLAGRPVADWFGDWNGDVRAAVAARTARIAAAGRRHGGAAALGRHRRRPRLRAQRLELPLERGLGGLRARRLDGARRRRALRHRHEPQRRRAGPGRRLVQPAGPWPRHAADHR